MLFMKHTFKMYPFILINFPIMKDRNIMRMETFILSIFIDFSPRTHYPIK